MLEIFADPGGKKPFELGEAIIGEPQNIPVFVKNTGDTRVIKIKVISTYPDTTIHGHAPLVLFPGEKIEYQLTWQPGKKTLEMARAKMPRTGGVHVDAMEVIE